MNFKHITMCARAGSLLLLLVGCAAHPHLSKYVRQPIFNLPCSYERFTKDSQVFVRVNHNPTEDFYMHGDFDASVLFQVTYRGDTSGILIDVPNHSQPVWVGDMREISGIANDRCTAYKVRE